MQPRSCLHGEAKGRRSQHRSRHTSTRSARQQYTRLGPRSEISISAAISATSRQQYTRSGPNSPRSDCTKERRLRSADGSSNFPFARKAERRFEKVVCSAKKLLSVGRRSVRARPRHSRTAIAPRSAPSTWSRYLWRQCGDMSGTCPGSVGAVDLVAVPVAHPIDDGVRVVGEGRVVEGALVARHVVIPRRRAGRRRAARRRLARRLSRRQPARRRRVHRRRATGGPASRAAARPPRVVRHLREGSRKGRGKVEERSRKGRGKV